MLIGQEKETIEAKDIGDSDLDLPANGIALAEARASIAALHGKQFVNRETRIVAQLSSSAKGKLISNKATSKSKANGFTREQHNAMAAVIDRLFEAAILKVSRPDRAGDANIVSIKRFAANVRFGAQKAVAWITVKESKQHGHHIYSVEAIKLEALGRIVEVACANTPHAPSASTASSIPFFMRVVNWVAGIFKNRFFVADLRHQ